MTSTSYHHGDLPNALKAAAAELITEKGPAGFSLREVARRAGVSHAAPAHHFGDSTGLLTALGVDAMRYLAEAMEAASAESTDAIDRLTRVGRAYIEVGREYPAHCELVFRTDLVDPCDPDYLEWGERAYGGLVSTLEAFRDAENPDLDVVNAARLCWAAMEGLRVLHPGMVARDTVHGEIPQTLDDQAVRFCELLVEGLRRP